MSKRFIDTELFDDHKFMDYSKDAKLLWIYLITKCDHAGLIKINQKLVKFQTGISDFLTVSKELGNSLVRVNEELYFIPKFLLFQYPNFPQSAVRQQQSALSLLQKYNIDFNSYLTVSKELDNTYEHEHDSVIVNDNIVFSIFYDKEINTNIDKEKIINYTNFVKFIFGENTKASILKNVLKLKEQVSYRQYENLSNWMKEKSITSNEVKDVLIAMDNYKPLQKKCDCVYSTLQRWLNKRQDDKRNNKL